MIKITVITPLGCEFRTYIKQEINKISEYETKFRYYYLTCVDKENRNDKKIKLFFMRVFFTLMALSKRKQESLSY